MYLCIIDINVCNRYVIYDSDERVVRPPRGGDPRVENRFYSILQEELFRL